MKLEFKTYNLEQINILVLKHYILNNPFNGKVKIAKDLGISERTLYRWLKKYKIKVRDNRNRYISDSELLNMLKSRNLNLK